MSNTNSYFNSFQPSAPQQQQQAVPMQVQATQQQQQGAPQQGFVPAATPAAQSERPAQQAGAKGLWINMVLDESGSMSSVTDPTIKHFNDYITHQKSLGSTISIADQPSTKLAPQQQQLLPNLLGSSLSVISPAATEQKASEVEGAPVAASTSTTTDAPVGETVVTLTKFDAPSLITVYDRTPIQEVPDLNRATYRPNGNTNLLDAIGHVITKCDEHLSTERQEIDRPAILVVILTDGHENASRTYNAAAIRGMIETRKAKGWVFVFLGANIDAWSTAQQYGIPHSNAFNFSVHQQDRMSAALMESTTRWRGQLQQQQHQVQSAPMQTQPAMYGAYVGAQCAYNWFNDADRRNES